MNFYSKRSQRATILSSYKFSGKDIPYSEYNLLVKDFLDFIACEIIDKGKIVVLPAGCGKLYIEGVKNMPKFDEQGKIMGLAPNWKETRKLWDENPEAKAESKFIYFFNEHTSGVRYHVTWQRGDLHTNRILYYFILSRTNKRKIAELVRNGKEYMLRNRKFKPVRHEVHQH